VKAATLLLPYFDLDSRDLAKPKPKRETTVISIMNLEPLAALARVTLWTDLSVPTLAFDIFLTGFDVEEVDLWQVFRGTLPGGLAPCVDGEEPVRQLSAEQALALRHAHAGLPDPANEALCSGVPHGDTLLRGYVTVDSIVTCSAAPVFPSDPGYFGAGGIASSDNALAGQYQVLGRKAKVAESGRLVAIEAMDGFFGPGDATFYGRYVGYTGADAREPLSGSWGVRFKNDLLAKQSTELLVWRNSEAVQTPFDCSALGKFGWYPLGQEQLLLFDDQENPEQPTVPAAFPAETARVAVGGAAIPTTFSRGAAHLDLRLGEGLGQGHVTARLRQGPPSARGLVEAVSLDTLCPLAPAAPANPIPLPPLP
jgi:hypothetical protein